ncbi:S-layer homology domain-containing protein [Paenibacillus sp. BIHB 4019]|nr:S-layer homology domain-containing protein [Paenibacillus sp. BIHB 4019]
MKQAVSSIVNGYADSTFKPGKMVSQAEFVVMLMNRPSAELQK